VTDKKASSQAAWALLTCGVSESRVLAHRIRHLADRIQELADSDQSEILYQLLGDVIDGLPLQVNSLERTLDRTSYALSKMGQEFLKGRISLSDRTHVEEAVRATEGFAKGANPQRVANRHKTKVARRTNKNRGV